MSSFASGNLLRMYHLDIVKAEMRPGSFVVDCGGGWIAYLTENDGCPSDGWKASGLSFDLLRISVKAPVLLWDHPEDHGWNFAVLENGQIVSQLQIDYDDFYELEPNQVSNKQISAIFQAMLLGKESEVSLPQPPTKEQLDATFDRMDIEKFRSFGLDDVQIGELRNLLTLDNLWVDDEKRVYMVDRFKEIMGFDMDFIRWERVDEFGGERYNVLAQKD